MPYPNSQFAYPSPNQYPPFQQSGYYPQYLQPQQMSQPVIRPSGLSGRMVNNLSEITPQEVTMDGTVSLFPQSDYSCIYAKAWNPDGTIKTVRYVPEPQNDSQKDGEAVGVANLDILEDIMNDLNDIKDMLKQRPYYHKKPYRNNNNQQNNQPKQEENND